MILKISFYNLYSYDVSWYDALNYEEEIVTKGETALCYHYQCTHGQLHIKMPCLLIYSEAGKQSQVYSIPRVYF